MDYDFSAEEASELTSEVRSRASSFSERLGSMSPRGMYSRSSWREVTIPLYSHQDEQDLLGRFRLPDTIDFQLDYALNASRIRELTLTLCYQLTAPVRVDQGPLRNFLLVPKSKRGVTSGRGLTARPPKLNGLVLLPTLLEPSGESYTFEYDFKVDFGKTLYRNRPRVFVSLWEQFCSEKVQMVSLHSKLTLWLEPEPRVELLCDLL